MKGNFVFLDVETPNRRNASVCQIGALVTDSNLNILKKYNQLINPCEAFDPVNINLHGITAKDVCNEPTFEQFYTSKFKNVLDGSILVAHNVSFDTNVLNKIISRYEAEFPSATSIIDTYALARIAYAGCVGDYQLETLCEFEGIKLSHHHDAYCDAAACFELYKIMRNNPKIASYKPQDYFWHNVENKERVESRALASAMADLYGLIVGIEFDTIINESELEKIESWIEKNSNYRYTPIFEDVYLLLDKVLEDGKLTHGECEQILMTIGLFVASDSFLDVANAENILKGIISGIAADKRINLEEVIGLLQWRDKYSSLKLNDAYEKLFDLVEKSIKDEVITSGENTELVKRCEYIVDPISKSCNCDDVLSDDLSGSLIVLTGNFDRGEKAEITKELEEMGFIIKNSPTKKTNYVVMGNKGSEAYSNGNYGSKVKKAMEYDIPVLIEDDFFDMLERVV